MAGSKSDKRDDQFILLDRKAYRDRLRERYSRFGDEFIQYVCEMAFRPGGLRRLFARVIRPVPIDDDAMHDSMIRFLNSRGVEAFFAFVEPEEHGPQAEKPQKVHDIPSDAPAELDTPEARKKYQLKIKYQPPAPRPAFLPSTAGADQTQPIATARSMSDTQPLRAAPRGGFAAAGPWNGVERRSGEDRRSGIERRSGQERRRRVELVFKNRRFGSDRRARLERRSGRDRRRPARSA